jgi:cell wall-associated NlpC family hydrolase
MVYKWVGKYIGIPFVSNGRTIEGCDCYGLVRLVLRNEYGIDLPLLSDDYSDAANLRETAKLFKDNLPVLAGEKISEPLEKAVVVITEHGAAAHIGIAAGGGYILHTGVKTGSVCQRVTHPGLRGRIEGYYYVR